MAAGGGGGIQDLTRSIDYSVRGSCNVVLDCWFVVVVALNTYNPVGCYLFTRFFGPVSFLAPVL